MGRAWAGAFVGAGLGCARLGHVRPPGRKVMGEFERKKPPHESDPSIIQHSMRGYIYTKTKHQTFRSANATKAALPSQPRS